MVKIYRIISTDGTTEFVREGDLETVLCGACRGALRKESGEVLEYSRLKSVLLRCQKCGGSYGAVELSDEEARVLFPQAVILST